MEKTVLDFTVEQTRRLIEAPACSSEARAAAEAILEKKEALLK